jgi:tRNA pseudouridine55 synthase
VKSPEVREMRARGGRRFAESKKSPPSGFLLVDKPQGLTSRKVVDVIRNHAGYRGKIGHSGTLDPMASGLLVLCLGKATRLASYLIRDDKSYLAEMELGRETDTGDVEGRVIHQASVDPAELTVEKVEEAFGRYRGVFHQVPPVFSARKVSGKRAYELARIGQSVELKPSVVEIKVLDVLKVDIPQIQFYVKCSSGTYIRSLALDVGRVLGTGAHLTSLRRLEVGPFSVGEAEWLEKLKEECRSGDLEKWLFPPSSVLGNLSKVMVDGQGEMLVRQGSPVTEKCFAVAGKSPSMLSSGEEVQVWSASSDFLAVGRVGMEGEGEMVLYPSKVLG